MNKKYSPIIMEFNGFWSW